MKTCFAVWECDARIAQGFCWLHAKLRVYFIMCVCVCVCVCVCYYVNIILSSYFIFMLQQQ